jgi:hypothetical protein
MPRYWTDGAAGRDQSRIFGPRCKLSLRRPVHRKMTCGSLPCAGSKDILRGRVKGGGSQVAVLAPRRVRRGSLYVAVAGQLFEV